MGKVFILVFLIATFTIYLKAQTAVPRFVETLPASCNPTLEAQATVYLKGIGLFVCVPTPNASAATSTVGTYQKIRYEEPFSEFLGSTAFVDAKDNQAKTGNTGISAGIWHSAGPVTVHDLDLTTPMNLQPCPGFGNVIRNNTNPVTYTVPRNGDVEGVENDYKWCFRGEDKQYRVTFNAPVDLVKGVNVHQSLPADYTWIATPKDGSRMVSILDFARAGQNLGDGVTDNWLAIRSAIHWLTARGGGTLYFPPGDYLVNSTAERRYISLSSNIRILGAAAGASNLSYVFPNRTSTRIKLGGPNQTLFRIGEGIDKVTFEHIELSGSGFPNTIGVHGLVAYQSSQNFLFNVVTISTFTRGIYTQQLVNTGSQQFDYIQVRSCRFDLNTEAGIYNEVLNADWNIDSSVFHLPAYVPGVTPANGMYFHRGAGITVINSFGGGTGRSKGGAWFAFENQVSNISIINSQSENTTYNIALNQSGSFPAGELSYPIALINNIFGDGIYINASRNITSVANAYGPQVWNTGTADASVRITSVGDRWCYDGYIGGDGCLGKPRTYFDGATVLQMTGNPGEGAEIPATPARFGIGVQLQNIVFSELEAIRAGFETTLQPNWNKGTGTQVYCTNCNRGATPCTAGGTGAIATIVGTSGIPSTQWSCQ